MAAATATSNRFGARLGRALKWHWNLLFVGAGLVFGLLSGQPDVVLPALLAGELAYLGFIGLHPRFQKLLRGAEMLEDREKTDAASRNEARLEQLISFLSPADRARFESVRERSRSMTQLQKSMHTSRSPSGDAGFKTASLDKLLWLFLKLLHHKNGLDRFLAHTSEAELRSQLTASETQLAEARASGSPERLIASLEDKRATIGDRLRNHDEAAENVRVVEAELDKTEQKINHICEVGMTSRDGSELSHQIDGVAESVRLSERALANLDMGGIFDDTDTPPPLVSDEESRRELE